MTIKFKYSDGGRLQYGLGFNNHDCVVRALSNAFNVPYIEMRKEMGEYIAKLRNSKDSTIRILAEISDVDNGIATGIWVRYMKEKGFTHKPIANKTLKVKDIKRKGTVLIGGFKHATVIKDGVLYDIGDVRNMYVDFYLYKRVKRACKGNLKDSTCKRGF